MNQSNAMLKSVFNKWNQEHGLQEQLHISRLFFHLNYNQVSESQQLQVNVVGQVLHLFAECGFLDRRLIQHVPHQLREIDDGLLNVFRLLSRHRGEAVENIKHEVWANL